MYVHGEMVIRGSGVLESVCGEMVMRGWCTWHEGIWCVHGEMVMRGPGVLEGVHGE